MMITSIRLGSKSQTESHEHRKLNLEQIRRQLKVVQYNSHMAAQSRENETLTDPYVQKSITSQFHKDSHRL